MKQGGFSRLDHTTLEAGQRSQLLNTATSNKRSYPAFQTLIATLPRTAKDIYYRDNIGNVSTSTISYDSAKAPTALLLAVKLRYPMLGGWKSAWYQVFTHILKHIH
jgi:oligosaccharyltransferase complex subunit alpha (ribophorin I)